MGNLLTRAVGFTLRIYALFDRDPLLNVAPYGKCNEDPDALDWLAKDTGATITQSCLDWQGISRCWFTYIPEALKTSTDSINVPLVIHLHGAGGCASLPAVGWGNIAEDNDFVVVWPQGTRHTIPFLPDFLKDCLPEAVLNLAGLRLNCWNDGSQLFGAEDAGIDDLGFLQAMLQQILVTLPTSASTSAGSSGYTINTNRIYMSGHSNGATMAQRFALQTSGLLAGVIALSGAGQPNDPEFTPGGDVGTDYSPTPIIFVSGTIDGVVPFSERAGPLAGAFPSLDGWASINSCPASEPIETNFVGYDQFTYLDCSGSSQVVLLKIPDQGHHPFTKGAEPLKISPVDVIANCPFRGIPMFYEPDCQLGDLDTPLLAWNFIQQFQLSTTR